MSEAPSVNSGAYWDHRFSDDWEAHDGPQQSRHFTKLTIENLPPWLLEQIRSHSLTLADWGCAQGDGTSVWANFVRPSQLSGIDISSVAIAQASKRYPTIRFENEDWLARNVTDGKCFDIVFSSNTLEHFHDLHAALATLRSRATKAIVLALPYRETDRIEEHFYSFLPGNIPAALGDGFHLIWSKVVDCANLNGSMWPGHQIILVYAKNTWTESLELMLQDCEVATADTASTITSLNRTVAAQNDQIASFHQAIAERDGQVKSLNQAVSERNERIASLNQAAAERDRQIASLNTKLEMIKNSTSWRVTSPLRFAKNIVIAPKRTTYQILRSVFWRLPASLRQGLHGPRHAFVRFFRELPPSKAHNVHDSLRADISWQDFNETILAKRSSYKGIFVQEAVIDWNVPLYQRPQHIATALGRLGYLVIYRTYNWAADNVDGFREIAKNVWITNKDEIKSIQGVVRSIYSTAVTTKAAELAKRHGLEVVVYEYIDHIDPQISGDHENIRRLLSVKKFAFEGGADFIVASSRKLYEEAVEAVGKDKVILIQNGVDVAHYRDKRHQDTELPSLLTDFKEKHRAIVGYFGALAPWLWYECISELATIRPEVGFVFIGPDYYGGASRLPDLSNVLHLGTVDYKILPAYAQQFDVCFIPFKPGEIAKTTSPLKLFEYFALEKPVVVTADMDECTSYQEVFRGSTAAELSDAIDDALCAKDRESFKSRLRELADQNEWLQRAHAMEACFEPLVQETVNDLVRVFGVSHAFVERYKTLNANLNWTAGTAHQFLGEMNNLSRMYIEFAMSCVARGRAMVKTIENLNLPLRKIRYLDVGTGYGGFPVAFAEAGFEEVVGIELQDHLVSLAKANTKDLSNSLILRRNIVEDPIEDLGQFDLVTCNDVIEHVSDPATTLQKLALLLTPSGIVSLEIPNKDCITWVVADGHFQIFALTLLERDAAADYYAEMLVDFGSTKEGYFQEMGYLHPIEWYLDQLEQNGVKCQLLDTHKVCDIEAFPAQLKLLEARFQQFQIDSRETLSTTVFESVKSRVSDYLAQARAEYRAAELLDDKANFVNKYLRTFWTVIGVRR